MLYDITFLYNASIYKTEINQSKTYTTHVINCVWHMNTIRDVNNMDFISNTVPTLTCNGYFQFIVFKQHFIMIPQPSTMLE